ncbi:3-hydroxyacyl-CoA dehydrogenase NAD-binding domain-containing protein [Amphritea sp. HPY]|uniref:3-hydroxyacyl-CoA dehydrogenase/enoyl-CoA hydratase family protein n=1 Tax=Amphritea sp. HPY TaxID=3421652 RepID=UPI003D7D042B
MSQLSNAPEIKKVAVIGAGVMGAGIAAQAANGGAEVLLLDIVPADCTSNDRSQIAQGALDRFLKAGSGGGLMHPSIAERVSVGNIEDDFQLLADADWIIEVIVERLDIKQDLYRRIAEVRRPDAIVSSNTSTIPLARLVEGLPQDFCQHFVVTHYFNPPRYMRLVEIVAGEQTLPQVVDSVSLFNDKQMGKTVIHCADRPGFIGNRLGVFWMQVALQEAINFGLTVEEADAVMKVCGFPKTGIFGLWDLCGIDLMPSVTESLGSLLPENDDFAPYATTVNTVQGMLDKGYYGRKGRVLQGFYRQTKDDNGKRIKEVIDLDTLTYRAPLQATLTSAKLKPGQLTELLACDDKGGRYAWRVLSQMLHYATKLIPDVATEVNAFDQAMKLGYNWTWGPYQMIDIIGLSTFAERLSDDGIELSSFMQAAEQRQVYSYQNQQQSTLNATGVYQAVSTREGILNLADIKRQPAIARDSRSAVWDLGDDVWCMEFTGKVPALSSELLDQISDALERACTHKKALIFYNAGPVFAAGADLKEFLSFIDNPVQLQAYIEKGQQLFHALQTAPVATVAALSGKALGGGLELALHCQAIQAHAETYIGLVENQVGIVPGWGGCKELLLRCSERFGRDSAIKHCFELIQSCKVTASAMEARQSGILRDSDGVSMNLDRLLFDAKQQALTLQAKRLQSEPQPAIRQVEPLTNDRKITLSSDGYQAQLEASLLNLLSRAQADNWYQNFFQEEKNTNLALCQHGEAKQRMQHLMDTGRALKN